MPLIVLVDALILTRFPILRLCLDHDYQRPDKARRPDAPPPRYGRAAHAATRVRRFSATLQRCVSGRGKYPGLACACTGRAVRGVCWQELVRNNPMPSIHGRVCYHSRDDICTGDARSRRTHAQRPGTGQSVMGNLRVHVQARARTLPAQRVAKLARMTKVIISTVRSAKKPVLAGGPRY